MHVACDVDGVLYRMPQACVDAIVDWVPATELSADWVRELARRRQGYEAETLVFWRDELGIPTKDFMKLIDGVMDKAFGSTEGRHQHQVNMDELIDQIDQGKHRIDLVTTCWSHRGDYFRRLRMAWAMALFPELPNGLIFCDPDESKADFAYDVLIDDNYDNCLAAWSSGRTAILIAQTYNEAEYAMHGDYPDFYRVPTLAAAFDLIDELETDRD